MNTQKDIKEILKLRRSLNHKTDHKDMCNEEIGQRPFTLPIHQSPPITVENTIPLPVHKYARLIKEDLTAQKLK